MSEFLTDDEVVALTGRKLASHQIQWLEEHHWKFERTAAQRPVVGRLYARLKLAGIKPTPTAAQEWSLDLSKVS